MEKMICPNCNSKLKRMLVDVEDAQSKAVSWQCTNCDYFTFEPTSAIAVMREIKEHESALKMKQKLINLSKDRVGMYFNKDIVRSLNLKAGNDVFISVPDKKRIVIRIGDGRKDLNSLSFVFV